MPIRKCVCKNESQDKLHGNGNRVMNIAGAPGKVDKLRCTVCLKEYDVRSATVSTEEVKETKKKS